MERTSIKLDIPTDAAERVRREDAYREQAKWPAGQPMETAPHDGTRVLAYAPSKKRFAVTWWRKPEDKAGFIGWGEFNQDYWPATVWWPLPPTK